LSAFIASRGKSLIVAFAAVQRVVLRTERLIDERQLADMTEEALLVPVLFLVGKILGVGADLCLALLAGVGKQKLVAGYTVGLFILEDIPTAGKRFIAVMTAEMISMKVLIHCSSILAVEY